MHVAEVLGVGGPEVGLAHLNLVVVAELVAFAHNAVGVVEVVLHARVADAVGAEGIGVDVVVIISAEQVVHFLVVAAAVLSEDEAAGENLLVRELGFDGRGQVEHQRVVVLGLDVVEGIAAAAVLVAVGGIELVEVNLTVGLGSRPPVNGALPLGQCKLIVAHVAVPHLVVAARHVLPVVGLRVLGVAVVELCALVHAVLAEGRRGKRHLVGDVPVPGKDGRGSEVVHHARVALLAVLVAPVGIVVIVVGEPVGLVGRGALRGALGGVAPCGERERVAVGPFLLEAEEVAEGVVERALDIAALGPAVGQASGEGPSAVVEAGGVGVHAAQRVVTVGGAERQVVARLHAAGAEVVVVAAGHVGHGETVALKRH